MPAPAAKSPPHGSIDILAEANGIGVKRNGRWIIRDVSLAVRSGEIVTLIGPNGGGKTTTAKTLLGLFRADAGHVRQKPGLTIGYVPQRFSIDWSLPLDVARLMTLTKPHSANVVREALARVGADHLIDRQVQHLSGGEFQRVQLARAIVGRPDLLVLDEPVQGIDYAGEIAIYELIRDIRRELGCGVLLISHDLHIVMAETDAVVCIDGHVCCSGPPSAVIADDTFRRLFGIRNGAPLAVYSHHHDHVHTSSGTIVPAAEGHAVPHDHTQHHTHSHDGTCCGGNHAR